MSLSAKLKELLNNFSKTQPGLQDKDLPFPVSSKGLGDAIDSLTEEVLDSAMYLVDATSGAIGTHYLDMELPKGAIITKLLTDAESALTSSGAATLAIKAGSDVLKAATDYNDDSYTGVDSQLTAPVKLTAAGKLNVVVAGAALTGGKLRIMVSWIKPKA